MKKAQEQSNDLEDEQAITQTVEAVVALMKENLVIAHQTASTVFDIEKPGEDQVACCYGFIDFSSEESIAESQNDLGMASEIARKSFGKVTIKTLDVALDQVQAYIEEM